MTILLAIQCKDGEIVVAADSAATFVTPTFEPTAKQHVSKLSIINSEALFAHSGAVGMGQRLEIVMEDAWLNKSTLKKLNPGRAMQHLRNRFWQEVVKDEAEVVEQSGDELKPLARMAVMQQFLVAFPPTKSIKHPTLIHFNWQCQPEMLSDQFPTVALGSGQSIADPFLSFIRRVLWKGEVPSSISDGIFAASWTMRYVIKASAAYVDDPIQIAIMRPSSSGGSWKTEIVENPALDEHFENVSAIEKYISDYPSQFQPPE